MVNNYRGPTVAPHNAYRTHPGEYNDWCVIVCHSDEEWQRLVQVMGGPSWAAVPKLATVIGRLEHQEELDEHIEAWSMTLGKYELTERCQAAGVRALPVQSAEDRVEREKHSKLGAFWHTEFGPLSRTDQDLARFPSLAASWVIPIGSSRDSPLEGTGFELVWGFSCQAMFWFVGGFLFVARHGSAVTHWS